MGTLESLNVGVVGACGRGGSFRQVFDHLEGFRVHAVCDIDADGLPEAANNLGASKVYTDYYQMLLDRDLDAVLIGTPMPFHVSQATEALDAGLHVLSEVPAGISVEECRALVEASQRSEAIYMMAENYIYSKPNILVRQLVRQGLLGTTYYAEGEYLHELKDLNERTTWRRKWQTGIDGVTYGTHSLGPILQWMPGDRVESVCCAGSGHHYRDPRGDLYENQDSCVMLCRMRSGGLVKIRVDMLSDRPHAMTNYALQGTDGCYESARAKGGRDRIWLRAKSSDPNVWFDLENLEEEYLPSGRRELEDVARRSGHGGGDFFVMSHFCQSVRGAGPPIVGIHEAMDITLPGLMSQQSIAEGARCLDVPDSRDWV